MYAAFEPITGKIQKIVRPPQGCNFDVTRLDAELGRFIVKTGDADWKITELEREANVLSALTPYALLVPAFLARHGDHFLFSYLEGRDLVDTMQETASASSAPLNTFAVLYGAGLTQIHAFCPDLPRPEDWLTDAIKQCESNVRSGNVRGQVDSFSVHSGKSVDYLLVYLLKERPTYTNQLRFCHGDWCMPNVLVKEGMFAGAVDWSNGGFKDYRYDLATGLWSLRRNGLAGHESEFLQSGYGYTDSVESLAYFEALYALL